jgi:hypothetical protein
VRLSPAPQAAPSPHLIGVFIVCPPQNLVLQSASRDSFLVDSLLSEEGAIPREAEGDFLWRADIAGSGYRGTAAQLGRF